MGASAESNPTNFTPGTSLTPGMPASWSEGKWLACRIVLLCAGRYYMESLPQVLCVGSVAGLIPHTS